VLPFDLVAWLNGSKFGKYAVGHSVSNGY
jgi:hypothetical protein